MVTLSIGTFKRRAAEHSDYSFRALRYRHVLSCSTDESMIEVASEGKRENRMMPVLIKASCSIMHA